MKKDFDSQLVIPINNNVKEVLKLIADREERSMTAQARYFLHEALWIIAEEDRLDEIEANAF